MLVDQFSSVVQELVTYTVRPRGLRACSVSVSPYFITSNHETLSTPEVRHRQLPQYQDAWTVSLLHTSIRPCYKRPRSQPSVMCWWGFRDLTSCFLHIDDGVGPDLSSLRDYEGEFGVLRNLFWARGLQRRENRRGCAASAFVLFYQ